MFHKHTPEARVYTSYQIKNSKICSYQKFQWCVSSRTLENFLMKSSANKKLLKLISTEVLLQIGFEKATEQSLNLLNELFSYFIEKMVTNVIPFTKSLEEGDTAEETKTDSVCRFFIDDLYKNEQYQIPECMKFLEQQIAIKMQLLGKHSLDCDESLFHALRLLPKGVSLRSVFKNTKTTTLEEKKSTEITEDIHVDNFMSDFIDRCSSEMSRRVVGVYSFDCSKIIDNPSGTGLVPLERFAQKPKEFICEFRDFFIAEQELFTDDFYGTEKCVILK